MEHRITETIPGTWSVHQDDQDPVSGTAVYKYRKAFSCEILEHGIGMNSYNPTQQDCRHINAVRLYIGDRVLEQC